MGFQAALPIVENYSSTARETPAPPQRSRRSLPLLAAFSVLWLQPAEAQQTTLYTEYDKTVESAKRLTALENEAFGEQISLYTGSLGFSVTDVSLPGNSTLPVSVGRRFDAEDKLGVYLPGSPRRQFGDWSLDVPELTGVFPRALGWVSRIAADGTFPNGARRCSIPRDKPNLAAPPLTPDAQTGVTWFAAGEYWHGNFLHIPGAGKQEMMVIHPDNTLIPTAGGPYHWMTRDQWFFSCAPSTANGVSGESFIARSPDGVIYKFNWFKSFGATQVNKPAGMPPLDIQVSTQSATAASQAGKVGDPVALIASGAFLRRYEVHIYVTEVQDRFGNRVLYTYDSQRPENLLRVEGFTPSGLSDGRRIDITYNATTGLIETISAGTRVWRYRYSNDILTEVTLPDQSRWQYDFSGFSSIHIATANTEPNGCWGRPLDATQASYTGSVTHPSGAVGTFTVKPTLHSRSNVPFGSQNCFLVSDASGDASSYAFIPPMFGAVSLQARTVSGPGLDAGLWTYTYSQAADCSSGGSCPSTKTVEVAGPASWERHTFSNRYRDGEGLLVRLERGASATQILSTQTFDFLTNPAGQAFIPRMAVSPFGRGDGSAEKHSPLYRQATTLQGRTFTWEVASDCGSPYCFDGFARPTKVVKSSSP